MMETLNEKEREMAEIVRQKEEEFKAGMGREQFEEMLDLQKTFDERVFKERGITQQIYIPFWEAAWLDELGELNHEMKSRWCWWKSAQKPEDKAKVLEELVDVWHFGLMYMIEYEPHQDWADQLRHNTQTWKQYIKWSPADCIRTDDDYREDMATALVGLTAYCGFTMREVYEAYKTKNAENHARQDRGY